MKVLNALGQHPTDEDVFNMIAEIDVDESGEIEIEEFMMVVSKAKEKEKRHDETDLLAAFVAIGGNDDATGSVSIQKLLGTIKEFELAVDLASMLQAVDKDGSGRIDFQEFRLLLS